MSRTEESKLTEANCSTRVPGRMPRAGPMAVTRATTPPWAACTPLGVPVDPEV